MITIKFPLPPENVQKEIILEMSKVSGIKKYDVLDKVLGITAWFCFDISDRQANEFWQLTPANADLTEPV